MGPGAAGREDLDSCFSEFHLGRLPPLHFCLLEAAGPWGHCMGRLKGFGRPWEQRGQRPDWAQSAQRGRGRRRVQGRLCPSGRDQAWEPWAPPPPKPRRPGLLSLAGTWWGPSPSPFLTSNLGVQAPSPLHPPKTWCPSGQPLPGLGPGSLGPQPLSPPRTQGSRFSASPPPDSGVQIPPSAPQTQGSGCPVPSSHWDLMYQPPSSLLT